jgi:LysR family transcriptional activator of glutamate synthase operon
VRQLHPPPAHPPIGVVHQRNRPLSVAAQSLRHHLVEVVGRNLVDAEEKDVTPVGTP